LTLFSSVEPEGHRRADVAGSQTGSRGEVGGRIPKRLPPLAVLTPSDATRHEPTAIQTATHLFVSPAIVRGGEGRLIANLSHCGSDRPPARGANRSRATQAEQRALVGGISIVQQRQAGQSTSRVGPTSGGGPAPKGSKTDPPTISAASAPTNNPTPGRSRPARALWRSV
jgi:hypothetical protein